MHRWRIILFLGWLLLTGVSTLRAQPGTILNLKDQKPAEFAKKVLRAEKTGYGKLGKFQELMQNTFTNFNYLFNANKRMQSIMNKSVEEYKEPYDQLISFYPYDEAAFAKNAYLDTVIEHATAGLLLHDLRNKYVDELYLLLGKAYYYEQKYDTAHQLFQYLNYAFAPKDDGYYIPIGSNISRKDGIFTIMNAEKSGKEPRNDGLVWQAKNYIRQGNNVQAKVLLDYLKNDVQLPERLIPAVYETRAFFYYQLKQYDSAAQNLVNTRYSLYKSKEKARAYYLTGQLFALAGHNSRAAHYFSLAKANGANPLLSIYAALKEASMHADSAQTGTVTQMELLEKLRKKEKYARYKDVIYYAQSLIQRQQGNLDRTEDLLNQSLSANKKTQPRNSVQKSRSFYELGDLLYQQQRFSAAANAYDSVAVKQLTDSSHEKLLNARIQPLRKMNDLYDSIGGQDSLQHLAQLPEKERFAILKDKAKEIRKAISKREQDANGLINPAIRNQTTTANDLFASNGTNGTLWYFNNTSLKSKGFNLFKEKFGNRPNVDNWQRINAVIGQAKQAAQQKEPGNLLAAFNPDGSLKLDSAYITPEDLMKGLPLSKEAMESSDKKIAVDLLAIGKVLQNSLENFKGALGIYDSLIKRFPESELMAEVLFNQYVCWTLLGGKENAQLVKSQLNTRFKSTKFNQILQKGAPVTTGIPVASLRDSGTRLYNDIYQLFIAGDFRAADSLKKQADARYGTYYWTPQLLYIEAIYHVSKREDSVAINRLNYLISHFKQSLIRPQAANMLRILKRRKEIESYLRNLKITPNGYWDNDRLARLENAARSMDDLRERRIGLLKNQQILESGDTTGSINQLKGQLSNDQPGVALNHVVPEENEPVPVLPEVPQAPEITDSVKVAKTPEPLTPVVEESENNLTDSALAKNNPEKDSGQGLLVDQKAEPVTQSIDEKLPPKNAMGINGFKFDPKGPTYVAILLRKVAPVFAAEAANAFNRYNLLAFEHQQFKVNGTKINDYDMIIIGPFDNRESAKEYQSQIQPATAGTILPWLSTDKYQFIRISPQNMDKLKSDAEVTNYLEAWKQFEAK